MGDSEEEGGTSTSTTQLDLPDQQLLQLLDSLDKLFLLRDSLSQTLSHGWMEIAAARYAMGPSRISQPVFSLKPCSASTVVCVSQAQDVEENAPNSGLGCKSRDSALQFVLRQGRDGGDSTFDEEEQAPEMGAKGSTNLRQRHTPGISNSKQAEVNSNGDIDTNSLDCKTTEVPHVKSATEVKKKAEALVWFGRLFSPHLQTAQSSFAAASEILVKLATIQSSVLATYSQITEDEV